MNFLLGGQLATADRYKVSKKRQRFPAVLPSVARGLAAGNDDGGDGCSLVVRTVLRTSTRVRQYVREVGLSLRGTLRISVLLFS